MAFQKSYLKKCYRSFLQNAFYKHMRPFTIQLTKMFASVCYKQQFKQKQIFYRNILQV